MILNRNFYLSENHTVQIMTIIKVKKLRKIMREEGRKNNHRIRISPAYIQAMDKKVMDIIQESLRRMYASKRKTLMEQDV